MTFELLCDQKGIGERYIGDSMVPIVWSRLTPFLFKAYSSPTPNHSLDQTNASYLRSLGQDADFPAPAHLGGDKENRHILQGSRHHNADHG